MYSVFSRKHLFSPLSGALFDMDVTLFTASATPTTEFCAMDGSVPVVSASHDVVFGFLCGPGGPVPSALHPLVKCLVQGDAADLDALGWAFYTESLPMVPYGWVPAGVYSADAPTLALASVPTLVSMCDMVLARTRDGDWAAVAGAMVDALGAVGKVLDPHVVQAWPAGCASDSPKSPGVAAVRCLVVAVTAALTGEQHADQSLDEFFDRVTDRVWTAVGSSLSSVLNAVCILGVGDDAVVSPVTLRCFDMAVRWLFMAAPSVLPSLPPPSDPVSLGDPETAVATRRRTLAHMCRIMVAVAHGGACCCQHLVATDPRKDGHADVHSCLVLVRLVDKPSIVQPRRVISCAAMQTWTRTVLAAGTACADLFEELPGTASADLLLHPCLTQGPAMAAAWAAALVKPVRTSGNLGPFRGLTQPYFLVKEICDDADRIMRMHWVKHASISFVHRRVWSALQAALAPGFPETLARVQAFVLAWHTANLRLLREGIVAEYDDETPAERLVAQEHTRRRMAMCIEDLGAIVACEALLRHHATAPPPSATIPLRDDDMGLCNYRD